MWLEQSKRIRVIFGGLVQRSDFGFSQVDANGMLRPAFQSPPLGQFFSYCSGSGIVKTHAINNCSLRDGAENSWWRVARLRMPGHPTEFTEAEAQGCPGGQGVCVFVHAGGQSHRIRKAQPQQFDGEFRWSKGSSKSTADRFTATRPSEQAQ